MSRTRIFDIVVVALMLIVGVLAAVGHQPTPPAPLPMPPPTGATLAAIALGTLVLPLAGIIVSLIAGVSGVINRDHAVGDSDFSSFGRNEERAFLPHERWMRQNASRAWWIGCSIAVGGTVLGAIIVLGLYTPCSKYCDHAPAGCKTDAQVAEFKRTCETSCGQLEREKGQPYVEMLTGCGFANSTSGGCEEVTKVATSKGLWCEQKN